MRISNLKNMDPPTFEHLRPENFNKFNEKQLDSLRNLTRFHIDSFDWIFESGFQQIIDVMI